MSAPTEGQPRSDVPPPYPEPVQAGYPPPQGDYPPPQGDYPPPQAGYPPPQAGYPPPQAGYPPSETAPQSGYPPPQPAVYPPPQVAAPSQTNTVVVQQPQATAVVTGSANFGPGSMPYNCHICHTQQVTRVNYKSGVLTWIIVFAIFVLGFFCCLFWPFCCVPLCISGTKDVYHTCPNCNNQVGVYRRIG